MRALLLAFAFLVFGARPALAQDLDIKGIRIGMSQFEIQDLHGQLPLRDFSVAGIPSKYGFVNPDFLDGKLDRFVFFFDSTAFDEMLESVKTKYPSLACRNSKVSNIAGTTFTQTECHLKGKDGILSLSRFSSDVTTSSMSLTSHRLIDQLMKERRERKRDL